MNIFSQLNQSGLDMMNGLLSLPFIAKFAPIFADLPIFFLPLFLLTLWVYYGLKKERGEQEDLIFIFLACVGGLMISITLQKFVHLDRPDQHVQNLANLLLNKIPEASFPSDHASVSFAFLSSLFFWNYTRVFYSFLPFVLLMNLCRIIVGVHWPFDIIAGILIGIIAGYVTHKYIREIKFVKKVNSFIIHLSSFLKL